MAEHLDERDGEDSEGSGSSFPGLLLIIWHHKSLVVFGLVVGAALGLLFYVQATPVYEGTAQVLVVKKRPDALPLPGSEAHVAAFEDYLPTHQVIIKSPLIVGEAVRQDNLGSLSSLAGRAPDAAIRRGLQVERETKVGPTNILNLSYRCSSSEDCAVVLKSVLKSYRAFLDSTYRNVSDDTVKFITQARDVLETKLSRAEQQYRKFRMDHPMIWKNKEGVSVTQDRLFTIEGKRAGLLLRKAEVEARLGALDAAVKQGRSRPELLAMVAESSRSLTREGGKTFLESLGDDSLAALQLQERLLRLDYGPDHPKVRMTREQIKALRSRSDLVGKNALPEDPVQAYVQSLKLELGALRDHEKSLAGLLQGEQNEARKFVTFEVQDDTYRTEITRHQQLFESVLKRLQELNLLKDYGGYESSVISPPGAGRRVAPVPFPIFAVACFLGLLAGIGLAYLAEVTTQSFHTPEEIRKQLGLPVVGHVPFFKAAEAEAQQGEGRDQPDLDPILCSLLRPKSREAESYRGVRTALFFGAREEGHKVIQITSPDMGDGKSTLVANLGVCIAQSGKTVVLVDADFRRPRIHKLFGVSHDRGLASVITGEAELPDVLQPSAVPGLFVLPCGPVPPNPAEILVQPRFKELLDLLRERYDFVIIDTPPVLAVTDPSVVAPLADGVVLTIRIAKNVRMHARRAKEILETLGATLVGVVVNDVDPNASSTYGYNGYRYGYAYGYRYYTGDKSRAYYAEEQHAAEEGGANGQAEAGTAGDGGERQKAPKGRRRRHRKTWLQRLWERL